MRMLRILTISSAALTFAPAVAAQQTGYIGLLGGYNQAQDSDWVSSGGTATAEFEAGYALGAFVGAQTDSGLRYEGELTFRTNRVDTIAATPLDGQVDKLALMVNFIYEFGAGGGYGYGYGLGGGGIRPYLGLGGGGAMVHIDEVGGLAPPPQFDDSEFGLAYQFIGGVGFEMSGGSVLFVDYRYFATDEIGFTDAGGTPFDAEFVDWTVTLGLRTHF